MLSALTNQFQNIFASRKEGKDYLGGSAPRNSNVSRDDAQIKRIGTLAGAGAGAGAVLGAAVGGAMAAHEISKVPLQSVTVDFRAPSLRGEQIGMIPADDYVPTPGWVNGMSMSWGYPSRDNGVPTVPVMRNNPLYHSDNATPRLNPTSQTFTGRGTPTTTWQNNEIRHHSMNSYSRSVIPHTESVYDHTRRWTEQESYTVYESQSESYQDCVSSYNSDGSTGQDCHTAYRTVQVPRTEYRTVDKSEDVYRDELRGFYERYSPNVATRVVGHYESPRVSFDHGVNTASYVLKGMLIGAGIGALALGVAGALEDKYFPGVLPGYKPKERDNASPVTPPVTPPSEPTPRPEPSPAPRPEPKPVPAPAPYFGDVKSHAHEGRRHSHAGGDRWHFHGCPDEGKDPLDTSVICFKADQVPSGYLAEEAVNCSGNGSVCFKQKGSGAA